MSKIAIMTDSNAGITPKEANALGVYVIPMPFYVNGKVYYEENDVKHSALYKKMEQGATITTSMPVVGDMLDMWEKLLEDHDEIVYIPMSSGLSSSCNTATALADDYDGKIEVVNNQRISVTQRLSVYEAKHLAELGKSANEIKAFLEETKFESSIYIMVGTLEYLKRGGRVSPAAAALGTVLKIKPVLQIQGERLDAFAKARTLKQGKQIIMDALKKDMDERFHDETGDNSVISVSHTDNEAEAEIFRDELHEKYPQHNIIINPLSMSVACHIGPGSLAATVSVMHDGVVM